MLDETFQHLPGIGAPMETRLWDAGIRNWKAFLEADDIAGIGAKRKLVLDTHLRADLEALRERRWERFRNWSISLHYRAVEHVERIVYLDIETYGVKREQVAIIGISDGEHLEVLNGFSVDRSVIEAILSRAEAIVTYNGSRFDLPYLKRAYHLEIDAFTVDLEPLAKRAGYRGGLKTIERELGIQRDRELGSGDPLALWRSYLATGDEHFLEILHSYVEQDVMSLPILLESVMKRDEGVSVPLSRSV